MEPHIDSFNKAAARYDSAAELQDHVAARLAGLLSRAPLTTDQTVLEIGCGTGLLTRHLPRLFGQAASYIITDKAPFMLAACRDKFNGAASRMQFMEMDGQDIGLPDRSVDRIVSSMTFQWLDDPVSSLHRMQNILKADGKIHYATIGQRNFIEWQDHLARRGLDFGGRPLPAQWPGTIREDFIPRDYKSASGFLKMLAATGAGTRKPDYKEPSRQEWSEAVRNFDGRVTWHIVYGELTP